jgi:hypothetical protein
MSDALIACSALLLLGCCVLASVRSMVIAP